MRRTIDVSNELKTAAGDRALPTEIDGRPRVERGTGDLGRAYRGGRLVCGCVHVTISRDDRLGLTQRERRLVWVRFCEPLDDELRVELTGLVRRRGVAARRAAERVDPIEVVVDDPHGERQRFVGRLEAPQVRHGLLRAIEFELRLAR